jgi:hypothetical protein
MNNLTLTHSVTIKGRNLFGLPSSITFHPGPLDNPGWYWLDRGRLVPITSVMATTKKRRIVLEMSFTRQLQVFEHIGFLRWMGFNNLVIEANGWPPFCGGALFYYERLRGVAVVKSEIVSHRTVTGLCDWIYPQKRQERWGVEIWPGDSPTLQINIECDFPGELGKFSKELSLPNDDLLMEILQANTVGLPHWLYWPARALLPRKSRSIGWVKQLGVEQFRERMLLHRAQDLLGALSFLCDGNHLFAGSVKSRCAGHEADIYAVRDASTKLRSLSVQLR